MVAPVADAVVVGVALERVGLGAVAAAVVVSVLAAVREPVTVGVLDAGVGLGTRIAVAREAARIGALDRTGRVGDALGEAAL